MKHQDCALCVGLTILLACGASFAKSKTDIKIVPGPTSMSEEEKAIQSDQAQGIENAVILVEETVKNDDLGTDSSVAYHLRAKVLSNEGRALANIEIPHNIKVGDLKEWWGRTLLPDGTIIELKEEELKEQSLGKVGRYETRILKGALRGVVPGSVIDYGYLYSGTDWSPDSIRVPLQRPWPVRRFRYRWIPYRGSKAAFRVSRAEGLAVKSQQDDRSVLVVGENFPASAEEPWMPPAKETYGAVSFYYIERSADTGDYWNLEAKRIDRVASYFCSKDGPIRDAIRSMSIPDGADLKTKLRIAYDWLASNVKNTTLRMLEEQESDAGDDRNERNTAKWVLQAKEGTSTQIDFLYMGLARALGALAHIVRVPSRTENYWDQAMMSMTQFAGTLVAVREPGYPIEAATIVDPGSGLPFGEVPWWFTGIKALVASSNGMSVALVPPTLAERNVETTKGRQTFAEDNSSLHVEWSRTYGGQQGYLERRNLRSITPGDRNVRLEQLCGASGRFEVGRAEPIDLETFTAPLQIVCEGELSISGISEKVTNYTFAIDGAWIARLPDFPSKERRTPIVFEFPRTEHHTMEFSAPAGFEPSSGPLILKHPSPFGTYTLSIAPTETGCLVERDLILTPLTVAPDQYETFRMFLSEIKSGDSSRLEFKRSKESS